MVLEELNRLSNSGAEKFTYAVIANSTPQIHHNGGFPIIKESSLAYTVSFPISIPYYTKPRVLITINANDQWNWQTPRVRCLESWVRKEIDWHVSDNGYLCWDHDNRWADRCRITQEILGLDNCFEPLAAWLIQSVGILLYYHKVGAERGYSTWQKSWHQFSHFEAGTQQYKKKRAQFCRYLAEELTKKKANANNPNTD